MTTPVDPTTTGPKPIPFPTPKIPHQLSPYLTLLLPSPALPVPSPLPICTFCHTAILPHSFPSHLRKLHFFPSPPSAATASILRLLISTLPSLNFSDVPPRPNGSEVLKELRVVEAWECIRCGWIRRDVSDVRRHVNAVHGVPARRKGSYRGVRAQSWWGGRRARYWSIIEGAELRPGIEGDGDLEEVNRRREGGEGEKGGEEAKVGGWEETESICRWGLFGKGFGHRTPRSWREVIESEKVDRDQKGIV